MRKYLRQLSTWIGRLAVLGVVVVAPWRNSASEAQTLRYMIYMTIVGGICALVSLWTTPVRDRRVNEYRPQLLLSIPMILALALFVFQTLPLSPQQVETLAPSVAKMRATLLPADADNVTLDDLYSEDGKEAKRFARELIEPTVEPVGEFINRAFQYDDSDVKFDVSRALVLDAAAEQQFFPEAQRYVTKEWGRSISIYPLASKERFPQFLIAMILFLSASVLFNTAEARRALLIVVSLVGMAFALLALAGRANSEILVQLRESFDLWWLDDDFKMSYGSFANKNCAAGYLIISLATCVFFLTREFLVIVKRKTKELENRKQVEELDKKSKVFKVKGDSPILKYLGDFFDLFDRRLVMWLIATSLVYAAILASMSRGGAVAATVAVTTAVAFLICRKETRRFWFVPTTIFLVAILALSSVSLVKSVDERMKTIVETGEMGESIVDRDLRPGNWLASINVIRDFPIFGTGSGTYPFALQPYDEALKYNKQFYYAENIFVQTLVETGVLGFLILIAEFSLMIWIICRYLRGVHSIETTAMGTCALTLLIGLTVASSVDYGIYLPGNLCVFALTFGALVGRQNLRLWDSIRMGKSRSKSFHEANEDAKREERRERTGLIVFTVVLALALVGGKWILPENTDAVRREACVRAVDLSHDEELMAMSPTGLDGAIADLKRFIAKRDDSFEARLQLAKLILTKYRLGYLQTLKEARPNEKEETLWTQTSPDDFVETFLGYQSIGMDVAARRLRQTEATREAIAEVVSNLYAARRICPIYSRSLSILAEFLPIASEMTWEDERQLTLLYALREASASPYDAMELFRIGCNLTLFKFNRFQRQFYNRAIDYRPEYATPAALVLNAKTPRPLLEETVKESLPDVAYAYYRVFYDLRDNKNLLVYPIVVERFKTFYETTPEEKRDYDFYLLSGLAFKMISDPASAVDAWEKATAMDESRDEAFFFWARVLCDYHKTLQREEDCVQALEEYCSNHSGWKKWRAEEELEKARELLKRKEARANAREKIRREREMDESLRSSANGAASSAEATPNVGDLNDSEQSNSERPGVEQPGEGAPSADLTPETAPNDGAAPETDDSESGVIQNALEYLDDQGL